MAVSQMQSLHGNKGGSKGGGARASKVAGLSAALFYGFMSVASVFLNKAIFEVWKYKFPASLVAGQTVFTVFAILVLTRLGRDDPSTCPSFIRSNRLQESTCPLFIRSTRLRAAASTEEYARAR